MKFRVWEEGTHEFDGCQKELTDGSYDGWRQVAVKYAEQRHDGGDWEARWPIKYHVRELGENYPYSNTGPVFTVEVEREMVPSFYCAAYRKPEPTPPGPHDHRTQHGEDVCPCAHPYADTSDCDRCVCKSGRHYFTADDGAACYWFVAADAAGARAILIANEVELEDEDGNAFRAHEHPDKLDKLLTFEEIEQDQAKQVDVTTSDERGKIRLIAANLGEWFTTDN